MCAYQRSDGMSKRIAAIIFAIAFLVIIVTGTILYFSSKPQEIGTQQARSLSTAAGCDSPVTFTYHFTDPSTITSIIPPVWKNNRHTITSALLNTRGRVPIYMPTSGTLKQGTYYSEQGAQFYLWDIDVGCGVTVRFDHVTEPVEKIRALFLATPKEDARTYPFETPLAMEAGELIGYTTGTVNAHNWNIAVYDAAEKNYLWGTDQYPSKEYYTAVCPFKYDNPSMAQAYEKLFVLTSGDISVEKNLCQQ